LNKKRQLHSTEDTKADVPLPSQKRPRKLPARLCDEQSILDEQVAFRTSRPTTTESSGVANHDLKVSFYFVFVDKLTTALNERFGKTTCDVLCWMAVFSPKRWDEQTSEQSSLEITNLCEKYGVPYAQQSLSTDCLQLMKAEQVVKVSRIS